MRARFTLQDLVNWTKGDLISGSPDTQIINLSIDTRTIKPGEMFIALEGSNSDGHNYLNQAKAAGASGIIVKGGFLLPPSYTEDMAVLQVEDTLESLGRIAKSYRNQFRPKTAAITGSVGKTTTRRFAGTILSQDRNICESQKNFNNLIGLPLTLLQLGVNDEVLLVELGADRVGEMEKLVDMAGAEIGAITAICESHLERFGNIETIIEEKSRVLETLQGDNPVGIVNLEGGYAHRLAQKCTVPVWRVGIEQGDIMAQSILQRNDGTVEFTLNLLGQKVPVHLSTLGKHNITNALIAAAISYECGLKIDTIKEGLEKFSGFQGRGIKHELPDGMVLVDDCYNSNPVSMTAAIEFLESYSGKRKILIAGEMWDLGKESQDLHRQIGGRLAGTTINTIIFVGKKTQDMMAGLESQGGQTETLYCDDADEAYLLLEKYLEPGDTILIKGSRGMHLEKIVEKLLKNTTKQTAGKS